MNLDHIACINKANKTIQKYNCSWLYLNGLTSAEGLKLPNKIGGWLSLNRLTSEEKKRFKKQIICL